MNRGRRSTARPGAVVWCHDRVRRLVLDWKTLNDATLDKPVSEKLIVLGNHVFTPPAGCQISLLLRTTTITIERSYAKDSNGPGETTSGQVK